MELDELKRQIERLDPITHGTLRNSLIVRYQELADGKCLAVDGFRCRQESDSHEIRASEVENRIEDPRLSHKETMDRIVRAIQTHERRFGRTWTEMVAEVRSVAPHLVRDYWRAHDSADCDIYGRWLSGQASERDLEKFRHRLAEWESALRSLIECHRNLAKQS